MFVNTRTKSNTFYGFSMQSLYLNIFNHSWEFLEYSVTARTGLPPSSSKKSSHSSHISHSSHPAVLQYIRNWMSVYVKCILMTVNSIIVAYNLLLYYTQHIFLFVTCSVSTYLLHLLKSTFRFVKEKTTWWNNTRTNSSPSRAAFVWT